jgi:hypothetical protein
MKALMVIPVTLLVGALTGCGGGAAGDKPADGGGAGNGGGATTALSCAVAPASMVNAALGTSVGDPKEQLVGHGAVCNYAPVAGAKGNVIVRIQTDTTRSLFDQGRATSDRNGLPTADLPGFEDAAYTSTIAAGSVTTNTVVALKGTVQVLVSSAATFDKEKALEQQIFAALA